jgi:hypothetical protein
MRSSCVSAQRASSSNSLAQRARKNGPQRTPQAQWAGSSSPVCVEWPARWASAHFDSLNPGRWPGLCKLLGLWPGIAVGASFEIFSEKQHSQGLLSRARSLLTAADPAERRPMMQPISEHQRPGIDFESEAAATSWLFAAMDRLPGQFEFSRCESRAGPDRRPGR